MTALYLIAALAVPSPHFHLAIYSNHAKNARFFVTSYHEVIGQVEASPTRLPFRDKTFSEIDWIANLPAPSMNQFGWLVEADRVLVDSGELVFIESHLPIWPLALQFVKWKRKWDRLEKIAGYERWIKCEA